MKKILKINKPPRIAEWLLKQMSRYDIHFGSVGDFEENFHWHLQRSGKLNAKFWYWSQVICSFIPYLKALVYWRIVMFRNYIKIALRNIKKNKFYSFVNIFGLALAIAVCVTGYINFQFSQSFDNFHKNAESIYLINTKKIINNNMLNLGNSPTPLTPHLKEDVPGVDKYVRIAQNRGTFRYGDKVFNESFTFMDDNFFNVFTFPMLMGNKDVLKDKSGIVITDEIANKYFGNENPIGKQITISPDGEKLYDFMIRGVCTKPTLNSSIRFSVCFPYDRQIDIYGFDFESWRDWTSAAFVQVNNKNNLPQIEKQLQSYIPVINESNPTFPIDGLTMTHFPQLAHTTQDLANNPFRQGMHPAAIVTPSIIALFVLLLVCFNYVNTAIAFASKRLKEIGIRKVVGSERSELVKQFMGENLILCFIALAFGMIISKFMVAGYDSLWPENTFALNYSENPGVLIFLIVLLLLTAIASGAYPAFYVSRFNPVNIFRGKQKLGSTNTLIRVLLTVQFTISITTIISGLILYKNGEFIKNLDLGFNKEQIIVVRVNGEDNFNLYNNAVKNHPTVISTGGSQHIMGRSWTARDIEVNGIKDRTRLFAIGENYFETAGFELVNGRKLNHNLQTDIDQSIIVNETLLKAFGLEEGIGKQIKIIYPDRETNYQIVGVVKDFYYNGVWAKIAPIVLRLSTPEDYRFVAVKFNQDELKNVSAYLESTWKQVFPHLPYDGYFQSDILAHATELSTTIALLFFYTALIVVIISGMGLFALVSLNIAKRTKEIGIRKILGASIMNISGLVSKEFVLLMLIASGLASVMGYFMVESFMSSIWVYYTDIGIMPFVLSILMMTGIALLLISTQVFNISRNNPVEALRDE